MKIKINDNESYEIRIEEVSLKELKRLVKKIEMISEITTSTKPKPSKIPKSSQLNNEVDDDDDDELKDVKCISCGSSRIHKKGFGKSGLRRVICQNCKVSFTIGDKGEGKKEEVKFKRKPMKWKNRDEVLTALKTHYFGKKDEKLKMAEEKQTTWSNIMKSIHGLRKRFNISPQEVGLEEYPSHKTKWKPKKVIKEVKQENSFNIPTPQPPLELKREEVAENSGDNSGDNLEDSDSNEDSNEKTGWWNRK